MVSTSWFLTATLLITARAQTPTGFTPQVDTNLAVTFDSTAVDTPGKLLPKAVTAKQPTLALSSDIADTDQAYMFVMLDLDVPPANGTTTRRVLLHAMITGFKTRQLINGGASTLLASTATGPASYLPPNPPATDTMPHRYVEFLFPQPAGFAVDTSAFADVQDRIGFDLAAFAAENKVEEAVAANFFTVDGRAAAGTATSSGGLTNSTMAAFEGKAGGAMVPVWLWRACGLAAMMVVAM